MTAALLLGGCTGDDPEPGPESSTGESSNGGTTEPEGPSPQELSEQVLAAADAAAEDVQVLGSVTGSVQGASASHPLTVEVLSLERTDEATLAVMRLSSTQEGPINAEDINVPPWSGSKFLQSAFLVDESVTKSRFLPLQFTDPETAAFNRECACPYLYPATIGPEPQTVHALFPLLPPEVKTVTLQFGETDLTVPDVPVG